MDFNDNPEEAAFRAEVKSWLAKHAPKFAQKGANVRREGEGEEDIAAAKEWQALKAEDRKSTRLNSSHIQKSRMPSSA